MTTVAPFHRKSMRFIFCICWIGFLTGDLLAVEVPSSFSVWRSGGGDFRDERKWNPDGVPTETSPIRIEGGEVSWIELELYDLSRSADTVIDGGTLFLKGTFRNGVDEAADIRLVSGKIYHTGNFFVLGHKAPSTLVQTGGSLECDVATGFFFSDHPGSPVVFQLDDGAVEIAYRPRQYYEDRWQAIMGKAQNDRWTINGGAVEIDAGNDTFVVEEEGSTDRFANRSVSIRRSSRLELNGGKFRVRRAARLVVGERYPGDALLTVSGGRMEILETLGLDGGIAIGVGAEGVVVVNDGELVVTVDRRQNEGEIGILVGANGGYGSLEITGGVVDLGELDLRIAQGSSSIGEVRMTGGALRARNILPASPSASAHFRFEGGLIVLKGDRRGIVDDPFFETGSRTPQVFYDPASNETRLFIEF